MKNKEITIDDLAAMIGKGFNDMGERVDEGFKTADKRFETLEKDVKLIKLEIEDVKLRLDNVTYRFELEELKQTYEKRLRAIESKVGIKFSAA